MFFYLRSANTEEISYLELKHKKIQISVSNYPQAMSRVRYDVNKMKELKNGYDKTKKELNKIEEKIDSIKNFWFLE